MGTVVLIAITLIIILFFGLAVFFVDNIFPPPEESPLPPEELDRIMSTNVGYYKVKSALKQAHRLGVGVLVHHGKVYSVVTPNSPKSGSRAFKDAYEKAVAERVFHHKPDS